MSMKPRPPKPVKRTKITKAVTPKRKPAGRSKVRKTVPKPLDPEIVAMSNFFSDEGGEAWGAPKDSVIYALHRVIEMVAHQYECSVEVGLSLPHEGCLGSELMIDPLVVGRYFLKAGVAPTPGLAREMMTRQAQIAEGHAPGCEHAHAPVEHVHTSVPDGAPPEIKAMIEQITKMMPKGAQVVSMQLNGPKKAKPAIEVHEAKEYSKAEQETAELALEVVRAEVLRQKEQSLERFMALRQHEVPESVPMGFNTVLRTSAALMAMSGCSFDYAQAIIKQGFHDAEVHHLLHHVEQNPLKD